MVQPLQLFVLVSVCFIESARRQTSISFFYFHLPDQFVNTISTLNNDCITHNSKAIAELSGCMTRLYQFVQFFCLFNEMGIEFMERITFLL